MRLRFLIAALCLGCFAEGLAQQPMGTVTLSDATLTGAMQVQGQRAVLYSSTNITALDHTAPVALARGGELLVCTTSQLHLLHSGTGQGLLFGLDRGALELRSKGDAKDVILTPDIRFTLATPGLLDLRLRVTRAGDTCVENRGANAPTLQLNSAFGEASYRLLPGQHVLFEHGDLHQVVDIEHTGCGCPQEARSPQSLPANATPAERAAAEHPFPEAASQDLTASPVLPAPYSRAANTAVLNYDANDPFTGKAVEPEGGTAASGRVGAQQPIVIPPPSEPSSPTGAKGIFHSLGRFFKRLFSGPDESAHNQ